MDVENDLGVSPQTTNFILPIGATINMDGTSMFQGITAVFLAQFLRGHGDDGSIVNDWHGDLSLYGARST